MEARCLSFAQNGPKLNMSKGSASSKILRRFKKITFAGTFECRSFGAFARSLASSTIFAISVARALHQRKKHKRRKEGNYSRRHDRANESKGWTLFSSLVPRARATEDDGRC
ncbi:hypothetical protein PUN28_004143 [Cardiocondyla obscurior]|uniref:Uncharacterized protein n=1 Tax=Cardiocondyla obscurior TaxID=286306 RepID=A0AAW2GPQ5_9HYME